MGATDVRALIERIAMVCGTSVDSEDSLATTLSGRPVWLILDGVDDCAEAALALAVKLLEQTDLVAIVLTASAALPGTHGQRLELGPLAVPGEGDGDADAMVLFTERVRALRPYYAPGPDELPVLSELLLRLGGLPLAVELAARRMAVLGAAEILERLRAGVEVLGAGSGRHKTLNAAMQGSWTTLDAVERRALAQCSVFQGGFSARDCEGVLRIDRDVLDVLQSLRGRCLVHTWEDTDFPGEMRFGLNPLIRTFAHQRLEEAGEDEDLALRHAEHMVGRAQGWARESDGQQGVEALRRLRQYRDNLLAVCDRAARYPALRSHGLAALLALEALDKRSGSPWDTAERLTRLLEMPGELSPEVQAEAYAARARGSFWTDPDRSDQDLSHAWSIFGGLGDRAGMAGVRRDQGLAHWFRDELDHAMASFRDGLAIVRPLGDRKLQAELNLNLGLLLKKKGSLAEAETVLHRALALCSERGEPIHRQPAGGSSGHRPAGRPAVGRGQAGAGDGGLGGCAAARHTGARHLAQCGHRRCPCEWTCRVGPPRRGRGAHEPVAQPGHGIAAGRPAHGQDPGPATRGSWIWPALAAPSPVPSPNSTFARLSGGFGGHGEAAHQRFIARPTSECWQDSTRPSTVLSRPSTRGPSCTWDRCAIGSASPPGSRSICPVGARCDASFYVAISTLRKMGLQEILITRDAGYLLAPNTPVLRQDA